MIGKISLVLLIILVGSLITNYSLYDKINGLHREISSLNQQISTMQKQSSDIENQSTIIKSQKQEIENLKSKLGQKQPTSIQLSSSSKSITAVAVRPIMVSDGFFQDVQYQGTAMNIKVD
ncbi:MAG TPA: hypothetical protein HA290_05475, partial [Candidatus Nitrosotenuis sp.]|nr:hypothetical protein [Candidatus Nitrosotenuis sp.]